MAFVYKGQCSGGSVACIVIMNTDFDPGVLKSGGSMQITQYTIKAIIDKKIVSYVCPDNTNPYTLQQ